MLKWTLTNNDTGQVLVLTRDPLGWEALKLSHNRSEDYEGFFFDFSLELSFSCKGGGKEFIDAAYDAKGSEGNVSILLEYQCSPIAFTNLFRGKINYSQYSQQYRGRVLYTVVDIVRDGITQMLKNRADTDVNIFSPESIGGVTLNPYNFCPYNFNFHSRVISIGSEFQLQDHSGCCFRFSPTFGNRELYIQSPIEVLKGDFEESIEIQTPICVYDATFNGLLESAPAIINTQSSDIFVQQNIVTIDWNVTGNMTFTTFDVSIPGGDPCEDDTCGTNTVTAKLIDQVNIRLRVFFGASGTALEDDECENPAGENIKYIDIVTEPQFALTSNPYVKSFSGSGSVDIMLSPGDRVWCYWVIDVNVHETSDMTISIDYINKDVNVYANTEAPTSEGQAAMIHEAWSRVAEGITDQTLAFKSEFFGRTNSQGLQYGSNGYGSFTALTDGLRLRSFTYSETPSGDDETKKGLTLKLKELFETCDAIWGIGLGIETVGNNEVIRVEEYDYFYQDVKILTISNIPNLQMSFNSSLAYKEVELGYVKWQAESQGGLEEPCSKARWVFPKIKSIENKLSLLSPYIASMSIIEETRRKQFLKNRDTRDDNDNFVIATTRNTASLTTAEKNENITVTGITNASSAYNLRFNLFSNFDRVMNQFTTGLTKDTPHEINFSYLEGNGNMVFQFDDNHPGDLNGISSANVQNTTYPSSRHQRGSPVLLPEIYTFDYPINFSDYLSIVNNPYGYIEFSEGTSDYKKGYIKTLEYSLKTKNANFTLIRKW